MVWAPARVRKAGLVSDPDARTGSLVRGGGGGGRARARVALVVGQQEQLDSIESNITQVVQSTAAGAEQLRTAVTAQRRARRLKLCAMFCGVVVVVAIVIAIVVPLTHH